jgi:hypothetical protein
VLWFGNLGYKPRIANGWSRRNGGWKPQRRLEKELARIVTEITEAEHLTKNLRALRVLRARYSSGLGRFLRRCKLVGEHDFDAESADEFLCFGRKAAIGDQDVDLSQRSNFCEGRVAPFA